MKSVSSNASVLMSRHYFFRFVGCVVDLYQKSLMLMAVQMKAQTSQCWSDLLISAVAINSAEQLSCCSLAQFTRT